MSSSSESIYSPLFSSIIFQCNTTIDKARHLAEEWFEVVLGEGSIYEQKIGEFKGQIIPGIPKTIHVPTDTSVLESLEQKTSLEQLYKNLTLMRNMVMEREDVAKKTNDKNHQYNYNTFYELHNEIKQVIEELKHVLEGFKVEIPADSPPNPVRHEGSEAATTNMARNWHIFHDYIVLVEYTNDIMKFLDKKYCSTA